MNITPKNKVPTSFLITYLYRRHIEFIRNASYLCGVGSMGAAGISCAEQMPYTMGFIIFAILCFIIYSYSAKENPMPDWVTLMERINTFNDNLSNKESLLKDLLDASKTEAIQNYTAEASYDTWKVEMLMRGKDSLVMNVDATDNTYIPLFSLLMKKESKYYLIKSTVMMGFSLLSLTRMILGLNLFYKKIENCIKRSMEKKQNDTGIKQKQGNQ